MELERRFIERTDFSAARRGYDPEEVDRHLREVADAAEQAADAERASDSLGSLAAEQIRTIVEAAETSASDIRAKAEADAEKLAADADRDASETRKSAETEAAGHVQRVQDATGEMTTEGRGHRLRAREPDERLARPRSASSRTACVARPLS